ncbi:unnamed protein product, partial [Brassica rapa subsp. narinosa]
RTNDSESYILFAIQKLLIQRGAGATSLSSTLAKPLTIKHTMGEGLHT